MKKQTLALCISGAILVTGCAAGIDNSKPVEKRADLNHICIQEKKTGLNYTAKETVQFISNSLAKKHIKSDSYVKGGSCKYLLTYTIKGKKEAIVRGKLVLSDLTAGRTPIGEVTYKYRGDEKDQFKLSGIQGQFDKMVAELFQNY